MGTAQWEKQDRDRQPVWKESTGSTSWVSLEQITGWVPVKDLESGRPGFNLWLTRGVVKLCVLSEPISLWIKWGE